MEGAAAGAGGVSRARGEGPGCRSSEISVSDPKAPLPEEDNRSLTPSASVPGGGQIVLTRSGGTLRVVQWCVSNHIQRMPTTKSGFDGKIHYEPITRVIIPERHL